MLGGLTKLSVSIQLHSVLRWLNIKLNGFDAVFTGVVL